MRSDDVVAEQSLNAVVLAEGERPLFAAGERVRILTRSPVGHYRVPRYLRGRRGRVTAVIRPAWLDNEEEGFGRNAGSKRHYYRLSVPMPEIWAGYSGSPHDSLWVEVFETWLEREAS